MASAFGFSVGDFISAAVLIKKVSDALKTAGGAAEDYQHAVIELEGLDRALKAVAALNPNESNALHVNAIRGMALSCQLPLHQFLKRLQSYERSLGPFAPRNSASGAFRKAKWAAFQEENIQALRAVIAAKVTSINLLLNLQISESISRIEPQVRNEQNNVLSEVLKIREELARVGNSTQRSVKEQAQTMDVLRTKVENVSDQIQSFSDSIMASQASVETSISTLRSVGEQIVDFVNSFPREIRHLLQRILRTNFQIYHLLLHFQNNLNPNPSILSDSNIFFEDALGRNRRLPFEWFQHWETFEGLLRAEFHGLPGEYKVTSGEYHLINRTNQTQLITKDNWKEIVFPGSSLVMSMIIQNVLMQHHLCPRPSCRRKLAFSSTTNGSAIVCSGCGLTCYLRKMPETADDVTVLESEEVRVEQQQIDEDYQIFGERPIPSDTMKIDEDIFDIQSMAPRESIKTEEPLAESMLPTLSAWGQVELDALLSGRNITKIEPQNTEDERVNPTPLDAWLDQVSVLSASEMGTPTAGHGTIHNGDSETNALECFRHIHIDRAYDKCSVASDEPQNARNLREVSFNARIFYRNIRDKYPQMPEYLVKRLAKANERRAERLGSSRTGPVSLSDSSSESSEDSIGQLAPAIRAEPQDTQASPLLRLLSRTGGGTKPLMPEIRRPQRESGLLPGVGSSAIGIIQPGSKEKSYWSQTYRFPGPHSSASGSSTRHSSLHGSDSLPGYDASHKSVRTFSTGKSPGSNNTYDIREPLLSLPPPPVELGTQKSFTCDICGRQVEVLRRRDWKKHVFQDLEPYLCTFEDCPTPNKTYTTRRVLVSHEMKRHRKVSRTYACTTCPRTFSRKRDGRKHIHFDECEVHRSWIPTLFRKSSDQHHPPSRSKGISVKHESVEESSCPFCGQNIAGSRNALMQHLGRHMEVISFAVVSKPYEEWQFYEDSVSAKSSAPSMVLNQNICRAVAAGDFRRCEDLLLAGANVNAIESGKSALYTACSEGHYAIAWLLLHKGADPELIADGELNACLPTALDEACSKGHNGIVSLLSRVIKNPTAIKGALTILIKKGNIVAFEELFSAYQRLGSLETSSILLQAVEAGQVQIVQSLFVRGIKLDSGKDHNVALLTALSHQRRDINMILALLDFYSYIPEECWRMAGSIGDRDIIVTFLKRENFLPRMNSHICVTAALNHCLTGAASKGDLDVIKILLDNGAEIQDEAIDCACRSGQTEATLFLLKMGAKPNSAHITTASMGGFTPIVKHLVDFDAKPTPEALLGTIRGGHGSNFDFLHSNYPHLLQGKGGMDAMEMAYNSGYSAIVIRLMGLGVPLPQDVACDLREARLQNRQVQRDNCNSRGAWSGSDTELHRAATRGHHEIVQLLLDKGFDPNVEGNYRENPLHRACEHNKSEVVRVLLNAGANPNGTNGSKLRTPLGYSNSTEIKGMLRESGAVSWTYSHGGWEQGPET